MEKDPSSYPKLRFLNEFADVEKSRNRLPHWSQEGVATFITFCQADSIPAKLLAVWHREREEMVAESSETLVR
jgi:hypothetical protein